MGMPLKNPVWGPKNSVNSPPSEEVKNRIESGDTATGAPFNR
jgi:hypothetical protein